MRKKEKKKKCGSYYLIVGIEEIFGGSMCAEEYGIDERILMTE